MATIDTEEAANSGAGIRLECNRHVDKGAKWTVFHYILGIILCRGCSTLPSYFNLFCIGF